MSITTNTYYNEAVNIVDLVSEKHYRPLYHFKTAEVVTERPDPILIPSPIVKTIMATTKAIQMTTYTLIAAVSLAIPFGIAAVVVQSVNDSSVISTMQNQDVPHTTVSDN